MKIYVTTIRTINGEQYAILEPIPLSKLRLSPGETLDVVLPARGAGAAPEPSPPERSSSTTPPAASSPTAPPTACAGCKSPNCPMRRLAEIVRPYIPDTPVEAAIRPEQNKDDIAILG